MQYTQKIEYEH